MERRVLKGYAAAMATGRDVATCREDLYEALRKERFDKAHSHYDELEALEPEEPRWPHRRGDLYRRLGHLDAACTFYEKAVDRYAALGFIARAAALARLVVSLDPQRTSVLARVDASPAKEQALAARGLTRPPPAQAARPLARVESADDEVRFDDAGEDAIALTLSDLEIVEETPPPAPPSPRQTLDMDAEPRRRKSEDLAQLPAMPFFADLDRAAFETLLEGSSVVEIADGERWLEAGEPSDALFVLTEGECDVFVPRRRQPVRLREGELLGESCLLDDVVRRADVVARGALTALRIPKATLDAVVDAHPEVGHRIQELLTRRLLANLLQTSPLFSAFDSESRKALVARFEVRSASADTVLIEAGKRSDGAYCLLLGQLTLDDGSLLRAGEMIGQQSLLGHSPSEHTVKAETDVLVLRLPRERFSELAALYPPVVAYLAELSD